MTPAAMTDPSILWLDADRRTGPIRCHPGSTGRLVPARRVPGRGALGCARSRAAAALRHATFGVLLALLPVAGCTYDGGIDNPAIRRVEWFSYAQGEDIQESCVPGTPNRYRLLYNADFLEQVRSYEVTGDGTGSAYLVARAAPGGASLSNIYLDDLRGSWNWYKSETRLDPDTFGALELMLDADGLLQHRNGLIRLNSRQFYWLVTACIDGTVEVGAWRQGPDDLSRLGFAAMLFDLDETGLPVLQPHPVLVGDFYGQSGHAGEDLTIKPFWLTVDDRGPVAK